MMNVGSAKKKVVERRGYAVSSGSGC